ncbi:hypothetical protein AXG93_1217s1550 [Marchantia polymorpha subsp. ruderalis]|uniref:Interferon-related developmental regulator N-terminal domain-containing protein n=1 Tax=Marchantia polymorpha subsp. ruderalis TaxID=1480154 RepID=A0A176VU51_MARPO|nr:hypothetical protein AXG93_1217s1550 [Marchantia polymorpha subsp. ruderalis]
MAASRATELISLGNHVQIGVVFRGFSRGNVFRPVDTSEPDCVWMGLNAKNQRRSIRGDDTDEDTLSTTSTISSTDFGGVQEVEEEQDEGTILDSFIEALYEKRSATREAGLRGLLGAFTSNLLVEFVEEKYETLSHLFLNSVKKGSAVERALASRALGLLSLTAGAGDISQKLLSEAWPSLVKVAKTDTVPAARIAALDSMAILSFVGGTDLEATESAMNSVWPVCTHKGNYHADQTLGTNRPSGAVKAAAMSAWALLLSTVPATRVASHHVELSLPTLSMLLRDDDLAVRTATGEALALLYEATKHLLLDIPVADDLKSDIPELASTKPQTIHKLTVAGGKAMEAKEAQVVEQMKALSVQGGGKGQSKKERYAQRASFRDILTTIELLTLLSASVSGWSLSGSGSQAPSRRCFEGQYVVSDHSVECFATGIGGGFPAPYAENVHVSKLCNQQGEDSDEKSKSEYGKSK